MITAIDKNTALVLIDLQKGIVGMSTAHPIAGVLENAARLVKAFRKEGLPIVIVNVMPMGSPFSKTRKESPGAGQAVVSAEGFAEIVEAIHSLTVPTDLFVTKGSWNAFYNTALHEELQQRGVTNIVLGGVSTSIGVEGTARAAGERGYNISFATDALTDSNKDAHENSLQRIFPRLGEQGTTAEIIEQLGSRS